MTTRLDLPSPDDIRQAADELIAEADRHGTRPSVLTLARRVGLANTTLRRHFPETVQAITQARSGTEPQPPQPSGVKRYQDLIARNAKLRRTNRELVDQLQLACAQIQRLSIDNDRLQSELEAAAQVTRLDSRIPRSRHADR